MGAADDLASERLDDDDDDDDGGGGGGGDDVGDDDDDYYYDDDDDDDGDDRMNVETYCRKRSKEIESLSKITFSRSCFK